ncbi:hypothetical protein HRbin29_02138 [bacterium HR29]|nr:hypothetical protein HRbin29_02138 [bacterium HR29]
MSVMRTVPKVLVAMVTAVGVAAGAWVFGGSVASAQPVPPAVFSGSVTIGGNPAPAGTVVVAYLGNTACGTTIVSTPGQYVLQCAGGQVGDTVTFTVNGQPAGSGTWNNTQLNTVNLVVEERTPTPTATPTRTPTPRAPRTGSGMEADGGTAGGGMLPLALLGVALLGLGAAGAVAARRAR